MAASTENMYNFSSTNGKPVIDLTKSPSPRKRFVTGVSTKIDPGSRPNGAKKLVVKNLRTTSRSDPNNYCNKTLVKLDDALTEIFQGQRLTLSNEELYKGCENVCKLGKAEDLAKKLSTRMRDHVAKDVWEILAKRSNEKNAEVLRLIISSWASWKKQLVQTANIFCTGRGANADRTPFNLFSSILTGHTCCKPQVLRFLILVWLLSEVRFSVTRHWPIKPSTELAICFWPIV